MAFVANFIKSANEPLGVPLHTFNIYQISRVTRKVVSLIYTSPGRI